MVSNILTGRGLKLVDSSWEYGWKLISGRLPLVGGWMPAVVTVAVVAKFVSITVLCGTAGVR